MKDYPEGIYSHSDKLSLPLDDLIHFWGPCLSDWEKPQSINPILPLGSVLSLWTMS